MGENQKEKAIRKYITDLEAGNVEGSLDFFDDNAEWVTNEGVFKGRMEIKAYTEWMLSGLDKLKILDDGIGLIISGDISVFQHVAEADYSGSHIRGNEVCIYRFSGEKCIYHFTISDRLSSASQVAGGLSGLLINAIIKQAEKGL